jgi:outer membrane protein, heavy metal efflux system
LRRQLLGIATDAVQTARQLQNVGQADAPDVLQAEVEAEQAALEYTTAQRVYIQEFRTLAALTGKADIPLSPLAGDLEQPPQIASEEISGQILRDSPTLKRAQQEVARTEAALRAAKRESVPDLTLRAGVQQNYQHLPEDSSRPVGIQGFATAGITLPIFNRNQGNVTAASAELERARSEVMRIELVLRQSIQTLLQRYLADRTQAERYREQMIPRAQRAYELYLNKYRNMASAYPQVIVSQRTLFQLRVAYLQVLQNLWSEAIALQNFTLSDGLNAPMPSGSNSTEINLPSASGVAVQ